MFWEDGKYDRQPLKVDYASNLKFKCYAKSKNVKRKGARKCSTRKNVILQEQLYCATTDKITQLAIS